jgi:hypothetical protein
MHGKKSLWYQDYRLQQEKCDSSVRPLSNRI